jgi:phosphoribosylanthranilate isomerase
MMKALVKICGIKEPALAYQAAALGADFIGLVFHGPSKRYVVLEQAVAIAERARQGGAEPVAVFVNADAEQMLQVCDKTGINIVQLHGDTARSEQTKLPAAIQRMFVLQVDKTGDIVNQADITKTNLKPERDFILFDSCEAGSGKTFNLENIKPINNMRFFLAGGLTPDNVSARINMTQPFAVDVSSGVEDLSGNKDINLIKQLIERVKLT